MQKIRPLAPHVADLIAAGEVVERPGAVVKELVENAIDAGATQITVQIANGGMGSIRVTDNGSGIEAGDVKTAFLRHATSKIASEFDLEAIGTLGFRGEALAAIAAVSRVELSTRTQGAEMGVFLALEGGVPGEVVPAGCPKGTSILVRDLFYNTPARMKFIKKDLAEGLYAAGIMQKIALSHPEISIRFLREGKEEFQTPGDGKLETAIYCVLGRDMALGLQPVKGTWDAISVEGFLSPPNFCKGTRAQQYFFVNGRAIRSRVLSAALEEAYHNQKMTGKFPACVLHIGLKLGAVDVNVHPTKAEVKFSNERQIFQAVYETARIGLEKDQTKVQMAWSATKPKTTDDPQMTRENQREAEKILSQQAISQEKAALRQEVLEEQVSAEGENEAKWSTVADGTRVSYQTKWSSEEAPVISLPAELVYRKKTAPDHRIEIPDQEGRPHRAGIEPKEAFPKGAQGHPAQPDDLEPVTSGFGAEETTRPSGEKALQGAASGLAAISDAPPQTEQKWPEKKTVDPVQGQAISAWQYIGEAFETYIIVSQKETILFIDKHAVHERILFDKLKAEGYTPMVQHLITPVVWTPTGEEGEALLQNLELLAELGFEVEEFGDSSLVVRGIPFDLEVGQTENVLAELAEILLQGGRFDPKETRDKLLRTMACKMAVKGGEKNDPQELKELIAAVVTGTVKYCPHGRPVSIELSRKEMERQFRRSS